jgi:hypothetical protein
MALWIKAPCLHVTRRKVIFKRLPALVDRVKSEIELSVYGEETTTESRQAAVSGKVNSVHVEEIAFHLEL